VLVGCAVVAGLAWSTTAQLRHWRDSTALFRHALAVTQNNHVAHAYLGTALLAEGRTGEAIGHYRESLALRPDQLTVVNNLAWLLATGADARLRDPTLAVELALRAARLSDESDPAVLDTLAAAYASAGRFADAARTAQRAARLGREGDDAALVSAIENRLTLYRSQRPFVEGR
jgi:Flp pilus assembly protein TadD